MGTHAHIHTHPTVRAAYITRTIQCSGLNVGREGGGREG